MLLMLHRRAFTLIELLVVVAIIALLISILLPSLSSARAIARAVKCGAQMHSVGQAIASYCTENSDVFPASYLYPTDNGSDPVDPLHQDPQKTFGYQHWSFYLFNRVKDLSAFTCPEFERGGIPRTNPGPNPAYWMPNQSDQNGSSTPNPLEDKQAPFMAFTANGAIVPRNKFTQVIASAPDTPQGNGQRLSMFVKRSALTCGESTTILLTEFNTKWQSIAIQGQGIGFTAKGHRPLNPFYNLDSQTNEFGSAPNEFFTNCSPASLYDDPALTNAVNTNASLINDNNTQLNAVGRNHPGSATVNGHTYKGTSNFLYVDGHTERKNVYDTLVHKEWGDRYYAINGDNSVR